MLVSRYDLAMVMDNQEINVLFILISKDIEHTLMKVEYRDVKQKNRTINQRFEVRYYDIDKMMEVFKKEVYRPTQEILQRREQKIQQLQKVKQMMMKRSQ